MSSSSTTGPPQSSENSGSAEAALRRSNRLLGILPLDEDAIRNGQRSAESDVENLPHDADINAPHDDPLNNLPAALETTTTESDDLNAFNDASSHPSQGNSREGQDTVLNPTDGDGEPPFDENEPHLGDQEQGRITDPSSMRLLQPKTATTRPGGTSASSTSNLPSWDEARGSNTQHRRTVSPSTAAPATINVVVSALREVTTALTDVSQRLVKLESRSEIKAIPKTVPVPTGLHTAIRTSQLTTTNQASIVPPNQATKSFTIAHDSSRVPQSVKPSPTSMASCVDSLNIDPNMDALTRAMITASRLKPTPPSELFCGSSGKKTVEVYLHEITSDFRYILSSNNMKIALLISSMTQNTVAHITSLYTAKYGAITSSGNVDADVFLPRLVEVLREAYTTSTAHMDARLSWESLQLQGHTNFSDFIDTFQKLRTEVGALRGRIIEPSEALGRLWGCLPSSLRQWAGDYLPPPACQDLTEREFQYYITRLRNHCQHGDYHLLTTATSSTTTSTTTTPATLASSVPTNTLPHVHPSQQPYPPVNSIRPLQVSRSPTTPSSSTDAQAQNCFRCAQPGHRAGQCSAPTPLNHNRRCKRCGHSKHAIGQCPKPTTVRCARCGRTGHLASICLQQHCGPTSQQQQHQQPSSTVTAQSGQESASATTSTSATNTAGVQQAAPPVYNQAGTDTNASLQCVAECFVAQPLQQHITTTCPTTITMVNSTTPIHTIPNGNNSETLLVNSTIPEAPKMMMATDQQPGALYTDLTFISINSSTQKVRVMIDTGSSRSYINSNTLQHALQQQLVYSYRRTTTLTVVTANGATFNSSLQAQLQLNTRQGPRKVWLHCADQLINDILIGVDLLLDLDIMILMANRQPLLRSQVGPLRASIIKLIDNKPTARAIDDIVTGDVKDGELPELTTTNSLNVNHSLTSQSTPLTATPSDGHPLPSAVIHNETEDTVQPSQPQLTFDLDNYITNYFTSIVSYTAVDGEQAHYQVADFDRCPGLTNTNTVDTLTVVPQPDGSYRHYHKLPWKSSNRPSVNLRGIQARTDAHLRRLSHEDFHQYNDCIQDLLHRGIIRPLKAGETPRWAMCHFGVKGHALSTTPLRPVFTGTQIGRHLHRPSGDVAINVINPLLLLRTSNIFHIEDLSKAFYSMYVWSHEELWLCFWHQQSWFCFEKCPMGIAPSTGFLANSIDTILTELQASHYPYTVPTITHVDDITQVFKTVQDREAVHDLNIKHFAKHHFYINADKRITNDSTRERALGVWIDDNGNLALYSIPPLGNYDPHVYDPILNKRPAPIDDSLDNNNSPSSSLTVQEAFSYVCACYDPLGLAAETTTRQRLLLRQALTSGLNNKDELPNELASQLRQCRRQLCNMMPTPRYVAPLLDPTGHPIYFACVDASSQAIGLTITARGADRVVAHSLLVPRSKALWTVVRLELQAIALAIPYIDQFVNTFKNGKTLPLIVICSDSLVNVQRLQSTRAPSDDLNNWDKTNINKTKQLLKQRGYLIRHLKGSANPADPISRGLPVQQRHDEKPKHYDSDYLRQWIDDFVDNYHATLEHCHAATTNTNNSPTSDANNDAANDNTANDDAANDDAANDDTPNDDAANDNAANDDSANDDTANDDAANNDIANNDSLQVDIVSLPQVGYDVNILKNDQREDPHISAIIDSLGNRQKLLNIRVQLKYYFLDSDGLLRYYPHHDRLPRPQRECPVVIPSSRAKPLWSRLHEAHNHPGSGTGLRRLQRLVIWHRMPRDVRRWTSQCIICLRSRRERQATNTINKFRVKSTKPLEVVNIDYTGPYHGTSGSPVAVVMVCAATNYVCARLVPDRKLSTLVHCLFLLFHEVGFPSILCCDRDSTILAATDQLASWGIVTATIPAHSVKLAWWERVHRQLHDHMRSYLLSQQEALQRNGNLSPPPPSFADTEKALASSVLAANETPRGPGGFGITPNMMIRSNGEDMLPRSLVYNSTNSAEATQYVKRLLITPINDKTVVQQLRGGMALSLRRYLQLVRLPHLKRHDGRVRYQVPIDHPASRLQPGDECYYWRPRAHKLSSCWLPATFIARPAGTNFAILQKPTGKRITEYFFNVMCVRTEGDLSTTTSSGT